jgi:hypothetical protein
MINQVRFNKFSGKYEDFEDVCKIPRSMKIKDNKDIDKEPIVKKYKNADSRLSYKNRRSINKDFKDFMNNQ